MKRILCGLGMALVVAGCAATPELTYSSDLDGGLSQLLEGDASPDGGTEEDGGTTGTQYVDAEAPWIEAGPRVDSSSLDHDAGAAAPPPSDSGAGGPTCPSVISPGVQCCTSSPPTSSRTCVGQSCSHCGDCLQAGCDATQFCCAAVNGGGKYKGTFCSDSIACPRPS